MDDSGTVNDNSPVNDISSVRTRAPRWDRFSTAAVITAEIIGFVLQLSLVALGLRYLNLDGSDEVSDLSALMLWCAVGTVYLLGTVTWLNFDVRVRDQDPPFMRAALGSRVAHWVSLGVTFSSSLVGLSAAIELILVRQEPGHLAFYELFAVWAMLVSWALFHWGYARMYHSRFYRAVGDPPLVFPGTPEPRLIDFVYFAFTNGTSFASSDVSVVQSRMRWTVVWHTTFSFFFNALIIVLTMNTIFGGLPDL